MPRPRRSHSLPAPAVAWADFKGFQPGDGKQQRLRDLLGTAARQARGNQPRPFYSVREIAGFFGVSVATVATVYRELDREGLLVRKRASGTLVPSRRMQPRFQVRSVIAILIWLPGFMGFRDWREFVIGVEGELRRYNFVADLIFFQQGEELEPAFVDRVLAHHPDLFLWFCPDTSARAPMAALIDAGVRPIVIGDKPMTFEGQRYLLGTERALQKGMEEWARNGITSVVIPGSKHAGPSALHALEPILQRFGMRHRFTSPPAGATQEDLDCLGREPDVGVAFIDDVWCTNLCSSVPQQVVALLRRSRALVVRPINLLPGMLTGAQVDVIRFDWSSLLHRVADDLATEKLFTLTAPTVFEAEFFPRVDAAHVARHFRLG